MIFGSQMPTTWCNFSRNIFQVTIVLRQEYYCVDQRTKELRTKERGEFVLNPCGQFHVIIVNQKGEFKKVLHFREQDIVSTVFDSDDSASYDDEEIDREDEDYEQALTLKLCLMPTVTLFSLVRNMLRLGIYRNKLRRSTLYDNITLKSNRVSSFI